MKSFFITSAFLAVLIIGVVSFQMTGCTKSTSQVQTSTSVSITGLWEGTCTTPGYGTFYLSYTVYPDGSFTHKSKTLDNITHFAAGKWTLVGTKFSYTDSTINEPPINFISNIAGNCTYDSIAGTLTNGQYTSPSNFVSSTWTLKKVK